MQLYTKILIGLIAGAVAGAVANYFAIEVLQNLFTSLEPIGTAFIRLITMIVVPLVVASLMAGTASLGDLRKLGRIGGKTLGYYLCTTAVAVVIGLGLSQLIKPGGSLDEATRDSLAERYGSDAAVTMELAENESVGMAGQVQAGIALILGVDRILDMIRTAVNVTGDLTASAVIARSEGEELVPRPVDHPLALGSA